MTREIRMCLAAQIGVLLAFAIFALSLRGMTARAESREDARQEPRANVQTSSQRSSPVRVILPAPWEPAAPVRPAPAQAEPGERK